MLSSLHSLLQAPTGDPCVLTTRPLWMSPLCIYSIDQCYKAQAPCTDPSKVTLRNTTFPYTLPMTILTHFRLVFGNI